MRDFKQDVGRILDGRYKLLDFLGSGASGAVFRAYDSETGGEVAIKLFDTTGAQNEENLSFMTEAKAIAALSHENIVRLYGAGAVENLRYLVMEYVDGTTLRDFMKNHAARRTRIPTGEIISCARQILTALSHAHAAGIIHRDVKPQNIIVTKTGKIKVMDFGIAKLPEADVFDGDHHAVGTAHYISPEQASGGVVDARSDVYSLGVLLYEMATGCLPFTGETPSEIALRQVTDTPPPPRTLYPSLPVGLEQIILTAMQKNADRRFYNADEMLKAVDKLSKNPSYVFSDFSGSASTQTGIRRSTAKRSLAFPILVGAFAAMTAVAVLVVFLLVSGKNSARDTVIMPDLYAVYYDANADYGENIVIKDVTYTYSESVPKDCVISQSPRAGDRYAGGIEATLVVSLGREPLLVERLPENADDAVAYLVSRGMTVTVVYAASDTVEAGKVISLSSEDTVITSDGIVTLTVSSGEAVMLPMPEVAGLPRTEAQAILDGMGVYYRLVFIDSASVPKGNVVSASVVTGDAVSVGVTGAVTLYISRGYTGD